VRDRREGPQAFYAVAADTLPETAKAVLAEAASSADPTLEGDQRRLRELDAERRGSLSEAFAGEMERHYSPGRTSRWFACLHPGRLPTLWPNFCR